MVGYGGEGQASANCDDASIASPSWRGSGEAETPLRTELREEDSPVRVGERLSSRPYLSFHRGAALVSSPAGSLRRDIANEAMEGSRSESSIRLTVSGQEVGFNAGM